MPLLQRLALHIGAVDQPGGRKVHTVPIPRIGGVLITFTFLLTTLIFIPLEPPIRAILVGAVMISAMGLTDDLIGLNPWVKFGVQWLVAAFFLGIARPEFNFPLVGSSQWLTWPLAGFCLVFMTNAVNLQDGLDGLAAGLVIIGGLAMGMYISYTGEWLTIKVLAILAAAVLGFLRVNAKPAKIFMGDSGSYLLGFVLMAVFLINNAAGRLPWWSALMFFAIPIFDTVQVMVRRALAGKSIFKADKLHLHHMISEKVENTDLTVYIEYMIASIMALLPMLILSPLKMRWIGICTILLFMVMMIFQKDSATGTARTDRAPTALENFLSRVVVVLIFIMFGIELSMVGSINFKHGVLPILIVLCYACWSWFRLSFAENARLSITISLVVAVHFFVIHQFSFGVIDLWSMDSILFYSVAALSLVIVLIIFLKDVKRYLFIQSSLEYLIIFAAILLFYLPVSVKQEFSTDLIAIELLCFFAMYRILYTTGSIRANNKLFAVSTISLIAVLVAGLIN